MGTSEHTHRGPLHTTSPSAIGHFVHCDRGRRPVGVGRLRSHIGFYMEGSLTGTCTHRAIGRLLMDHPHTPQHSRLLPRSPVSARLLPAGPELGVAHKPRCPSCSPPVRRHRWEPGAGHTPDTRGSHIRATKGTSRWLHRSPGTCLEPSESTITRRTSMLVPTLIPVFTLRRLWASWGCRLRPLTRPCRACKWRAHPKRSGREPPLECPG